MLRYGSKEWLERLRPDALPIARLGRLVVVRFDDGSYGKVIGGTPEEPTVISLTMSEMLSILKTLQHVYRPNTPNVVVGTIQATWVTWYNTSATASQQEIFDQVTKKLDAAGKEGLPGGSDADIIESYKFTYPTVYPALLNYRDSGGRRAFFAEKTPVYGPDPISKPKDGGPMETKSGNLVLHPGRFTYSDPAQSPTFKLWLDFVTKDKGVQVLRTQVSEGLLGDMPGASVLSTPYYTDYEFLVAKDLLWNPSIPGLPTWLPPGKDVSDYWGKPTPHGKPSLDPILQAAEGAFSFGKQITTLAVLIGLGVLIMKFAPGPSERPAHAH